MAYLILFYWLQNSIGDSKNLKSYTLIVHCIDLQHGCERCWRIWKAFCERKQEIFGCLWLCPAIKRKIQLQKGASSNHNIPQTSNVFPHEILKYTITKSLGALWAPTSRLRPLITSFTPFGRFGRVTHASMQWWDSSLEMCCFFDFMMIMTIGWFQKEKKATRLLEFSRSKFAPRHEEEVGSAHLRTRLFCDRGGGGQRRNWVF